MVRMTVGGRDIEFLVDSGAEHLVVTQPRASLSSKTIDTIGATGVLEKQAFCLPRTGSVGGHEIMHQFLYMPDCPLPLLGRDLLSKLRATITFTNQGSLQLKLPQTGVIMALTVPREEEWRLFLTEPGQGIKTCPDQAMATGLGRRQPSGTSCEPDPSGYQSEARGTAIPREALEGIQVHLRHLKAFGIIVSCKSPWNTPLLSVPKPGTKDYQLVQDLHLVNKATVTLHPMVPNPYRLLGLLPAEASWFSCLNLKDAFFSIWLAPESQKLFASYTWMNFCWDIQQQLGVSGKLIHCSETWRLVDTRSPRKRPRSANNRPGHRFENSWGLWDFANCPNFTVLAKPLYEVTKPFKWNLEQQQAFSV
ncbi:Gag-Pol polyprotein [Plecturocebus cupreus]